MRRDHGINIGSCLPDIVAWLGVSQGLMNSMDKSIYINTLHHF